MELSWLTESIENPSVLLEHKEDLSVLLKKYPFIASLHIVDAKLDGLNNGLDYQEKIKKAAVYSPNRNALYEYTIQPKLKQAISNQDEPEIAKKETPSESSQPNLQVVSDNDYSELTEQERQEKRKLEQEILTHAISSSILKESAALPSTKTTGVEEEKTSPSSEPEKIEIDDSMGVLAWLSAGSRKNPTLKTNVNENSNQPKKSELIEAFIQQGEEKIHLPKEEAPTLLEIDRPQSEFFSPENMAKMSLAENEDFVTETLAKIYAQQGNTKRAISAYEKLSLKFPEKSNYFARLIQDLKEK